MDVIKLRRRNVQFGEVATAVEGHFPATVVGDNEVIGIVGVDPHIVGIAMVDFNFGKGFTTIDGFERTDVQDDQPVFVLRISGYVHVVPGPLLQVRIFVDKLPG